jgi:hypothetical protein
MPLVAALWVAVLVPAAASAQGQRNPYSNLFGDPVLASGREITGLSFRSTAGAQMGWTLKQEFLAPGAVIPEGWSAGADASLLGQYIRDRAQVIGQARYSYQEYRQEPAFGVPAIDAGIQASVRPRTRLSLHGSAGFARSPYYQLMWLSPELSTPLPAPDRAAIFLMQNDTIEGSAGITSHYTKRSSLEVSGVIRETDFAASPQHDYSTVGGMVRWGRQMSRDLAIHAGYGREQLRSRRLTGDTLYVNDRLDLGVDYGKSLTMARRTFLGFTTGTSMVRENGGPQRFRLNGDVTLDHRFLRTWQLQMTARRGTDFLPGFQGAVFSDHAHASLAGYLAKRLLVNFNADGARGEAGLSDPRKFVSYTGSSKLTFAVTRHFGMFTQYLYSYYQVPADPLSLFAIPRGARQAVSFGVETWLPIFEKEKVPSDTR